MKVGYFLVWLWQPDSSLGDKTKPPDGAKPAQTPTDILQCDITPEYYIHHCLFSLCTPKNTHTHMRAHTPCSAHMQTHFPLQLQFFRPMFDSGHTMCCSTKYQIKQLLLNQGEILEAGSVFEASHPTSAQPSIPLSRSVQQNLTLGGGRTTSPTTKTEGKTEVT